MPALLALSLSIDSLQIDRCDPHSKFPVVICRAEFTDTPMLEFLITMQVPTPGVALIDQVLQIKTLQLTMEA